MTSASGGSLTGRQLGDFELVGLLGAGGMAEVYRGFDVKLKREVAVKVLPASLARDANYVQRFRTEAQRVAALDHPHIVPVYHFGEEGPLLYHVMPLLKESLRDRLEREGPLSAKEAVGVVAQIASALSAAHEVGLIHRDVKPENILLNDKNEALLTDFGIARPVMMSRTGRMAQTLSATGLPVGTPEYMAPEQLRGEAIDERMDIYALGAVLYELLTGKPPHEAETPYQVAALSLAGEITPPSSLVADISPELEDVVMTALAYDRTARYQDASAFGHAARRAVFPHGASLLTGLPGLRRTTRRIAVTGFPSRGHPTRGDELPTQPPAQDAVSDGGMGWEGWDAPGDGRAAKKRAPRTRLALFAVLAVALVVSLFGGASLFARQMNLPFFSSAPRATALPTATDLPSPTPLATATATPTPSPTPTPRPTATPKPPPAVQAAFVKVDSTTEGNWSGVYGSAGYIMAPPSTGGAAYRNIPGYLLVTIKSASNYTWVGTTTDPRALQKPPGAVGTGNIAACWYSGSSFTIDVGVTDGQTHRVALYLLDWDSYGSPHGRVERIDAVNAVDGTTLDSRTVGQASDDPNSADQFSTGKYLVWQVRGRVIFTVTNLYTNAVVSGIFFD